MSTGSLPFFGGAISAAVVGLSGIAPGASEFVRVCFVVFLVIFVVSPVWGTATGRRTAAPL